jgi:hypothetical protein
VIVVSSFRRGDFFFYLRYAVYCRNQLRRHRKNPEPRIPRGYSVPSLEIRLGKASMQVPFVGDKSQELEGCGEILPVSLADLISVKGPMSLVSALYSDYLYFLDASSNLPVQTYALVLKSVYLADG